MFGFIGNYFKNKREETPAPAPINTQQRAQSKLTINYDPSLIQDLEAEHGTLVELFGKIWSEGFEPKNYKKTASLISQFKSDFQAHLLTENVKFYVYLEQSLAEDPHNLNIVKEFRSDMNDIANAVVKFCKKYQGNFTTTLVKQFKEDYSNVGEVLTRRVSLEEKSLYILYQPR